MWIHGAGYTTDIYILHGDTCLHSSCSPANILVSLKDVKYEGSGYGCISTQPWMRTLEDGFWVKVQVHYCWGYLGLLQGQNDSLQHYTYIIRELTKTCRYQCQKTKISTWGQILFILHIALCHKRHQMTLELSYLLPKHNYKTKYSKWSLRHMPAV